MIDHMKRLLQMPIHNRRGGRHAERMRGGDDFDPRRDIDFFVAQDFADAVVENFRRGTRARPETRIAQHRDVLRVIHSYPLGAEQNLHRREGVDVDFGILAFDRNQHVAILEGWHFGIDAALHAHFRGAARDRLADFREYDLVGMIVRVGLPALTLEAAELASHETNIGKVNVAIDDVGHFVTYVFGAREIGALHDRAKIVAGRGVECEAFLGSKFLAREAALQSVPHRGRRVIEQCAQRRRFDIVNPVSPYFEIHGYPPETRSCIARTRGAMAGSSHSSETYSG